MRKYFLCKKGGVCLSVLFVGSLLSYLYFGTWGTKMLLYSCVILPVLSILFLWKSSKNIDIEAEAKCEGIKDHKPASYCVYIRCKRFCVCVPCKISVYWRATRKGQKQIYSWREEYWYTGKREECQKWQIQSDACGYVTMEIEHIEYKDFLGIWRREDTKKKRMYLSFRGKGYEENKSQKEGAREKENVKGLELNGLSGIREYKSGEPLRHIHWKTSARLGRLHVKEYEQEQTNAIERSCNPLEKDSWNVFVRSRKKEDHRKGGRIAIAAVCIGTALAGVPLVIAGILHSSNRVIKIISMLNRSYIVEYKMGETIGKVGEGVLLAFLFGSVVRLWVHSGTLQQGRKRAGWFLKAMLMLAAFIGISYGIAKLPFDFSQAQRLQQKVEASRYEVGERFLTEGDFAGLGTRVSGEHTILEVVMEQPEAIYLKGFVGADYTGTGWKGSSEEMYYEERKLFMGLQDKRFSPFTQTAQVQNIVEEAETTKIAIKNRLASSKYAYVPYGMEQIEEKEKAWGDGSLYFSGWKGCREYTAAIKPNTVKRYPALSRHIYEMADAKEYLQTESYYNSYVYKKYTDIPENCSAYLEEHLNKQSATKQTRLSYEEANCSIMEFLEDTLDYKEDVETYDGKEDFVIWLLEKGKTGYDIQYATIATLLYRYYGIPARYVEGYIVTKEQTDSLKQYEKIKVTEEQIHAWVEIYIDGVGWIPMEVLPKYQKLMERPKASNNGQEYKEKSGTSMAEEQEEEIKERQYPDRGKETKSEETTDGGILWKLAVCMVSLWIALFLVLLSVWCYKKKKNGGSKGEKLYSDIIKLCKKRGLPVELPVIMWKSQLLEKFSSVEEKQWDIIFELGEEILYSSHEIDKKSLSFLRDMKKRLKR